MLSLRTQRVIALAALIFGVALSPLAHAQKIKDLKPQGYVDDFANVLSSETKQKLTALCTELDQKAQAQIAVVTVKSLNGEPVEQFSIELATQWGVGPKQQSRGVMILVAPNDRKYRIEIGYGLEPILPDGKVGGFGRQAVPYLQHNDFDGAISLMTKRVAAAIAADRGVTLATLNGTRAPARAPDTNRGLPINFRTIIFLIFLLFPLLGFILRLIFSGRSAMARPRRYGGWWMGGPWYGGGLGGGSWGGGGGFGGSSGGFGGFGGGSFGGGGASGSW